MFATLTGTAPEDGVGLVVVLDSTSTGAVVGGVVTPDGTVVAGASVVGDVTAVVGGVTRVVVVVSVSGGGGVTHEGAFTRSVLEL